MNNYQFKYIIIGDSGVGKSSLLLRYTDDRFDSGNNLTIGVEFGTKIININNKTTVKAQIWDTSGQESFRSIVRAYYRNCAIVILVFDITNRKTYKSIDYWINDFKKNTNNNIDNIELILIGNKSDMKNDRMVSFSEAFSKAADYGIDYIETSNKNNVNVKDAFEIPAQDLLKKIIDKKIIITNSSSGITILKSELDNNANQNVCRC